MNLDVSNKKMMYILVWGLFLEGGLLELYS